MAEQRRRPGGLFGWCQSNQHVGCWATSSDGTTMWLCTCVCHEVL